MTGIARWPTGRLAALAVGMLAGSTLALGAARAASTGPLELRTGAFLPGATMPVALTCEGADRSPPLRWTLPPPGTRELALVMTDPDAPGRTFTHWVAYGIPSGVRALPGGLPGAPDLRRPVRLRQGANDAGTTGYRGPCPPAGRPHRYAFTLLALREPVRLGPGADRGALERAVRGRVLARASLIGRFGR
jgi:Raf kinase inhibitor-like YbhB/YbcL family protein